MTKKFFLATILGLTFSCISVAQASWLGYSPQEENFIFINGGPVKEGSIVYVKHSADRKAYKTQIKSIKRQSNIVEVEAYNLDKQQDEYYRLKQD